MKKYSGYLFIIIFGILSILLLTIRSETINKGVAKGSNAVVIF